MSSVKPAGALIAVLALLSFVLPMATDLYLSAFPRMAEELGTDASGVQLTLTAFLIGLAAGQLVLGPLSDRYGRRGLLLAGTALCAVSTALCALAPTLEWLVALRFVTGFAGAAGVVLGRAVISDIATGAAAARLFGILMALGGIAPIVAPLAGGAVFEEFGWRAVFWLLAAVVLSMFAAAFFLIPETLPRERRHAKGLATTVRAAAGVLSNRVYLGHTLVFVFASGALFSYISASPFLYQKMLGMSVQEYSVIFAAGALIATLSSGASAKLVGRVRPSVLLRIGLVAMSGSTTVSLLIATIGKLTPVSALSLLAITGAGLGLVFVNATALAIEAVPESAGTASAMLGTLQSGLGALAAPLVGLGGQHTAIPLYLAMTVCSVAALLCGSFLVGKQVKRPQPALFKSVS
ncbi:multidrug effflux MFS transporter [Amycolatopsis sp. cmx-4-54]|uniref:multidrug effflux MFS transporter n=1 Tax=Amycolatopsis sp. cmx-4-54 TaxID=2790936 RepID=UPI00397CDA25